MKGFNGLGFTKATKNSTGISNRYATVTTLLANQDSQEDKAIYLVLDASIDPTVNGGFALYEFLGNATSNLADYRKLSEGESLDIVPKTKLSEFDNDTNFVNQTQLDAIPTFPAPYLEELIPDSYLPSTTGNFLLKGSFFTEDMTVVVEGQVLNEITFISDNEVRVNLTTTAVEGNYNVTLNNGSGDVIFIGALLIVLGTVYEPAEANMIKVSGFTNITEKGAVKITTAETNGAVKIDPNFITIPALADFQIHWSYNHSPLTTQTINVGDNVGVWLKRVADDTILQYLRFSCRISDYYYYHENYNGEPLVYDTPFSNGGGRNLEVLLATTFQIKRVNGVMAFYINNVIKRTPVYQPTEELYVQLQVRDMDINNFKIIIT